MVFVAGEASAQSGPVDWVEEFPCAGVEAVFSGAVHVSYPALGAVVAEPRFLEARLLVASEQSAESAGARVSGQRVAGVCVDVVVVCVGAGSAGSAVGPVSEDAGSVGLVVERVRGVVSQVGEEQSHEGSHRHEYPLAREGFRGVRSVECGVVDGGEGEGVPDAVCVSLVGGGWECARGEGECEQQVCFV